MMDDDRVNEMYSDVGYIKGRIEGLDQFLRNHMENEEKKFGLIWKVLGLVGAVVFLNWFGVSGPEFIEYLIKIKDLL